jgi:hypothetical protein
MVFICQQPAVHHFQRVAFLARNNALAGPRAGLTGVFADAAAEQVAVKFWPDTHRFADEKAAQVERHFRRRGPVRRVPGQTGEADGLQIFRHAHGHFAQKRRRGGGDGFKGLAGGLAHKRRTSRQHLEHQAPE